MLRYLVPPLSGALLVGLTLSFSHACATADLRGAPDAGDDACTAVTVAFCDALEAGAVGCVADPASPDKTIRQLPTKTPYPAGCKANLVGPDEQGECKLVSTCTCTPPGDGGGPPQWQCDR